MSGIPCRDGSPPSYEDIVNERDGYFPRLRRIAALLREAGEIRFIMRADGLTPKLLEILTGELRDVECMAANLMEPEELERVQSAFRNFNQC